MAHEPQKWALGLIPVGLLWVVGTLYELTPIEADLGARSLQALGAGLLDQPQVRVVGRDVAVSGAGFTAESSDDAVDALKALRGVRKVDGEALTLVPEAKPYQWSATRGGAKIVLAGAAPDPATRTGLVDAAKAISGAEIADAMSFARGQSAALAAAGDFALKELALLSTGAASFSDGALTLRGEAASSTNFEAAMAALAKPPAGVTITADIAPPLATPYVFSVAAGGDAVRLTGSAPSLASRDAIAAAAAAAFPGAKIDNALSIARGAPAGDFEAAAKFAIAAAAPLADGVATLTDSSLSLAGKARGPGAIEAFVKAQSGLAKGFSVAKRTIVPLTAHPFVLTAERGAAGLRLSGSVPDEQARVALDVAAAKAAGGAPVEDRALVANGWPKGVDFAAASGFALAEVARLATGAAEISDGALTVAGTASDSAAYESAIADLAKLPAGMTTAKTEILPPLAKPFVFSVASSEGGVKLSGVAPSFASRDAIVAAAKAAFPNAPLDNALAIAGGAPAGDFDAAAKFAIAAIAPLDDGVATLTDAALSVSGRAKAAGAVEAFAEASKGLAPGFRVAEADVVPLTVSPFVLSVVKDADGVRLIGSTPDLGAHAMLAAAASEAAGGKPVVDQTLAASGWPADLKFADAARFAALLVKDLASGEARLSDNEVSVVGPALDAAAGARIAAALGALPTGLVLARAEIETPAPPAPPQPAPAPKAEAAPAPGAAATAEPAAPLAADACQGALEDAVSKSGIEFETGKAAIAPASDLILRQLAQLALRCEDGVIEVSGHTDNQGDNALNLALSKARATAVVDVLVNFGVPADRLSAVGYGADKPVASNDTEEGRARNRRIAFSVKR